jgi:hypothetical protein
MHSLPNPIRTCVLRCSQDLVYRAVTKRWEIRLRHYFEFHFDTRSASGFNTMAAIKNVAASIDLHYLDRLAYEALCSHAVLDLSNGSR